MLGHRSEDFMLAFLSRIHTRIYAIVLISVLALAVVAEIMLHLAVTNAYELRERHLSDVTDTAISMLAELQAEVEAGKIDLAQAQAEGRRRLTELRYGGAGYFFVLDMDLVVQVHPTMPDWVGKSEAGYQDYFGVPIFQKMRDIVVQQGGGALLYSFKKPDSETPERKISFVRAFAPWGWFVGTGSYVSDIDAALSKLRVTSLIMLGISSLVLIGLSTLLARSVTRPIAAIGARMMAMSGGDTTGAVPFAGAHNEIGEMARVVEQFRLSLIEKHELEAARAEHDAELARARAAAEAIERDQALRQAEAEREKARQEATLIREREAQHAQLEAERAEQMREQETVVSSLANSLAAMSEGDLTVRIDRAFPPAYERLRQDFNAAMEKFMLLAGSIVESARLIETETGQLSWAANELGRRTETQAASLEQTAAAMNEMSSSVGGASERARDAAVAVGRTLATTASGRAIVRDTVAAMHEIEDSSQKISKITGVIEEIAFQTNLLALNAGVEAARAGESGRGFAVVASEVRALAQRSSEAAHDIAALIGTSEKQVKSGAELASRSDTALQEIETLISGLDTLVKGIEVSSQEQSSGIAEVTTAINQLDQVTQQNAAMFEENSAAVQTLLSEARALQSASSVFTLAAETAPQAEPLPLAS